MVTRTPESLWRSQGLKWLKLKLGKRIGWHYRTVGGVGQRSGVPDDLFLVDGRFLAIEWKRPGYKAKKVSQQDVEIEVIRKAGGVAGKVSCLEELQALTQEVLT
jgi:hypothetical protein